MTASAAGRTLTGTMNIRTDVLCLSWVTTCGRCVGRVETGLSSSTIPTRVWYVGLPLQRVSRHTSTYWKEKDLSFSARLAQLSMQSNSPDGLLCKTPGLANLGTEAATLHLFSPLLRAV